MVRAILLKKQTTDVEMVNAQRSIQHHSDNIKKQYEYKQFINDV